MAKLFYRYIIHLVEIIKSKPKNVKSNTLLVLDKLIVGDLSF